VPFGIDIARLSILDEPIQMIGRAAPRYPDQIIKFAAGRDGHGHRAQYQFQHARFNCDETRRQKVTLRAARFLGQAEEERYLAGLPNTSTST
jgi:hypothetical protein